MEIEGDLSRLRRAVKESDVLLKRFSKEAKGEAKLGLDDDEFDRVLKAGEAKLKRLESKKARSQLYLDVVGEEAAEVEIATLKKRLDSLRDERVNVRVDVDRSALDRLQKTLTAGAFGGGGGGRGGLLVALGGLGGSARLINVLAQQSLPALAATGLVAAGALNTLAAATVAVGAGLAPLAGLLATIPAGLSGIAQAGGALFATFSGIPDAVKALGEVTTKAAVDDTAALEKQRAATDAVRSAKDALSNAQRSAGFAQEALTQARKDATRQLQDMKNASLDAQLAERGADLSLRQARAELEKVIRDPQSSQLDIDQARLGIDQARQSLREARTEAQRAQKDFAKANAGGVDKTPGVVQARRQLAEANRSVAESTRALSRAQEQAAVRTDKLSSSQQKLKEEMAKLSPAGREFARFLISLKPAFQSIRNASQGAALPSFQRGIEGAMKNLPAFRQALTNTSRVFGTMTERFGKFVGSKGFGKDFAIITRANNNVLRNFGRAMVPLGKAFNDVGVAAAPFVRWIGRAVLHLARLTAHSAKAGRESGGLARFLRHTRIVLEELSKATGNLIHGFGGLFGAAFPQGRGFLELLTRITGKFDDWANSAKGQNSIRKWFDDAKSPLKALGEALASVFDLMKALLTAPGSGLGFTLFARAIKVFADSLNFLARIPGVGGVIANIALLGVVAGRLRLGAAVKGLYDLAGGLRGISAAEADAAGSGLRRFGQSVRNMLSGLAKTRIGETIAGNISAGLGVGAIKFRRALDRLKGMMNRILGRAGEAAAGEAAGNLASTLPSEVRRREGRLGGFFGRFGGRLGKIGGLALAGGMAAGIILLAPEINKRLKQALGLDKDKGLFGQLADFIAPDKLFPDLKKREGPLSKLLGIDTAKKDAKDLKQTLSTTPPAGPVGPKRGTTPRREREQPTRTRTVEIQTPILSLSPKTVERSLNKIQTVLRRELGQARRLIARQVEGWDDVFKGFRLLRGDDPLHLGSGIRRSAEDARQALRGIVESLGNVLERLSSLARIEGREVGAQLAKGLGGDAAVRAAERIREGVTHQFRLMQKGSSDAARDMVNNLRDTFSRLPEVTGRSTRKMLEIVLTAMRALGATGRGRIVAAVDKIEGKAQGGVLPGYSTTDDTLIMARSGEAILTPERHQPEVNAALGFAKMMGVGRFGSLGEMFSRTGASYQKGGEVKGYASGGSVGRRLQLPSSFSPTHQTAGLGGYPAIDVMADPGTVVLSPVSGRVTRFSGSRGGPGGGGAFGYSMYIQGDGRSYFLTHLGSRSVRVGQKVRRGQAIGTVVDYPGGVPDHIHEGVSGEMGGAASAASFVDEAIPRVRSRVRGPVGAVRNLVGGALRKVESVANRRVRRAEPSADHLGAVVSKELRGKGGDYVSTSYGPPWGGIQGTGVTAFGINLKQGPKRYIIAADPSRLTLGSKVKVTPNPFGYEGRFLVGDTGGAIKGNRIDFYDWRGRKKQLAWGKRKVKIQKAARGGLVGRGLQHYAKGGFVPGFASGGFFDPKRPAKSIRSFGKALGTKPRSKGAKKGRKTDIRIKPYRLPRLRAGMPTGELNRVSDILSDRGSVARLQEDYDNFFDDAEIVAEEFYPSLPALRGIAGHRLEALPGGEQAIDWTAVESRGAELQGLIDRLNVIRGKYIEARDLIVNTIIPRLKAIIADRERQMQAAYKQLVQNINALQYVNNRIYQENQKKKPNKTVIGNLKNILTGLRRQNIDLSGSPDKIVVAPRASKDSVIGGLWDDIDAVKQVWHGGGTEGNLDDQLFDLQGLTGGGGRLNTIGDLISQYTREQVALGFARQDAPTSQGADTKRQEGFAFSTAISDLLRQFGSNIKMLSFAGGGTVPGRVGEPRPIIAHGQELIVDPNSGKTLDMKEFVKQLVEQIKNDPSQVQPVVQNNEIHYATPEPEPHTLTRSLLHELKAAV